MKTRMLFVLGTFLVFSAVACGDDDGTGPGAAQPIQTGRWSATTGFGSFEILVVAPAASTISEIVYHLSDFNCGTGVTTSGTVTVERTPAWSITDRSFEIENDLDPFGDEETIIVSGTFAASGQTATGSWSASWHGGACSGTWSGAPM